MIGAGTVCPIGPGYHGAGRGKQKRASRIDIVFSAVDVDERRYMLTSSPSTRKLWAFPDSLPRDRAASLRDLNFQLRHDGYKDLVGGTASR